MSRLLPPAHCPAPRLLRRADPHTHPHRHPYPDPTPAPTETPTPLKPSDLLDQSTYDTLISYGFEFGAYKDGRIAIYHPYDGSKRAIGYLDKGGLHFATTEFRAKEADGRMVDATRKTSAEENVFAASE